MEAEVETSAPAMPRDQLVETLWQIYDFYRTALLNQLYYAEQLSRYRRINMIFEIVVAIGTSTTSIGAWAIWNSHSGKYIWAVFAGVATLTSVIKPFLSLPGEIERFTKLHAAHSALYGDLNGLVKKIRRTHNLTGEMCNELEQTTRRYEKLTISDAVRQNQKLRAECTEDVMRQIPVKDLWIPA